MADIKFPTGCEMLSVAGLHPYAKNPKEHTDKDIDLIIKSIKRNGWGDPILVCPETCEILSGNGRYMAALKMGLEEIPAVSAPRGLTEKQKADLVIASNKLVEVSGYNDNLTGLIAEFDLSFDDFGMDVTIETDQKEVVEDEVPETVQTRCKRGDIWQLGNHRLMCGDSTIIDDVDKLMGGANTDIVFTDPPYNVAFNGRSGKFDVIKNDNLADNDFKAFIKDTINTIKYLNPTSYYICCNWAFYGILQLELKPKACIVWAKNVFGMGKGYRHQHEFILFDGFIDASITNESDLWQIKKDTNYKHPTQKPVELSARAIKNSTKPTQNVVDLFGGSGSTLIACEQLNRKCFMMELDEHYCDVIIQRWENLTGKQAVKL